MVLAHNIDNKNERTEDIQICQDTTFDTMMLSSNILNGLLCAGFYKPSPIQLLGIPLGKLGLDLLLEAKSGTGKTVVFSTIALESLDLNKNLQAIIITPTREIAVQIHDVLRQIGSKCEGLAIEVVIGGLSYQDDVVKMQEKIHILVGTPGRLKYLIKDKHIDVNATRLLILDEADKLMDKSFHDDIKYIHSNLPKEKQVIMSSATYPETVMDYINELVQDAQHVCPNSSNVLIGVSHRVTYVSFNSNCVRQTELRFAELIKILTKTQFKQCVIFCKYQARVSQLHKMLTKARWPSDLVHGKQDQTVRLDALKTLQEYKCRILISTDLVARGIDAKNVDLVINFEPPDTCETYLHRIGRSGRYGSIGMAISIVSEGIEEKNFSKMLAPITETIELKHFWTGEHFGSIVKAKKANEHEFNQSYNSKNVDMTDNLKNLWHFLVGESKELKNIESFQQLCTSYKDMEDLREFETFSNLVESYKSNESAKLSKDIVSIDDKQMEFDKLLCKDYLETITNLKDQMEINNKGSDKTINRTKKAQDKNVVITCPLDKIVKQKIFHIENHEHISDIKTKEAIILSKDESKYIDANDFLLQLPKSLHITTMIQPKRKNSSKKEKCISGIESEWPDTKSSQINKSSQENKSRQSSYSISYKSGKLNQNKEINNEKLSVSRKKETHKNFYNYNSVNREITYNMWYNNLKSNMRRIEQFLYIDELDKPC